METLTLSHESDCPIHVARAVAHLAKNSAQAVSLDELARVCRINKFHLSRLFKRHIGQSPHRALVTFRLYKAREILSHGAAPSLAAVAAETGFADQAHFCRTFKQRFGITPSAFLRCSTQHGCVATLTSPGW